MNLTGEMVKEIHPIYVNGDLSISVLEYHNCDTVSLRVETDHCDTLVGPFTPEGLRQVSDDLLKVLMYIRPSNIAWEVQPALIRGKLDANDGAPLLLGERGDYDVVNSVPQMVGFDGHIAEAVVIGRTCRIVRVFKK